MSHNLDVKIAAHHQARERIEEGRPVWDEKVKVNSIFDDELLTVREKGESIARNLRATRWIKKADEHEEVHDLIVYLETNDDPEELGYLLNSIRDEATLARVWFD